MEEIEVKFLDIDAKAMEQKILASGGVKKFDRVFRRISFDHPDLRLNSAGAWVRLRDEGDQVTLAYKQRQGMKEGKNDDTMIEEQVVVDDFEMTAKILRHIGLKDKFYEENRRIQFDLDGVEVDIDIWPLLKPYLEIEAASWEKVDETIKLLGLDQKDKKIYPTYEVYKLNGIEEHDYQILTFDKQVKKANVKNPPS